ncbi:hypothetical protein EOA75_21780 [Mesorhizobium sp. M1A.F.Ca.IN.022.07.1.1]|uniref:hypothetical protein n=1 Tax=Mesorhizobium sp. M1A.F.Ca.IN.022.07.1.1 TaxID=2496767 RepID=UPI000FC9E355|nr:hypothetical protein [Mesorhizobium sp. M1A.F.Ca.IN.022.07.1.1]RUV90705.1 hypothetical protein EOA75_21780 [Mesorhizobium sp. M1A.F.Ca.IN.022.07.1.1]TIS71651.1 MAG: hypothetical protein E5X11_00295 [Mesorhizobium sp.]
MNDVFGYIAYGDNELYHLGALLSALKLLHHSPKARIIVATDKPAFFRGYPLETILVSAEKKKELSFDWRYHFGIKAGGLIELLKRADRLLCKRCFLTTFREWSRSVRLPILYWDRRSACVWT